MHNSLVQSVVFTVSFPLALLTVEWICLSAFGNAVGFILATVINAVIASGYSEHVEVML